MINFMRELLFYFFSLHRYSKRLIVIIVDIGLCILSTWLSFVVRLEKLITFQDFLLYPTLVSIFLAIPIFWLSGFYRTIFRYPDIILIIKILKSIFIYGLLFFLIIVVFKVKIYSLDYSIVPRSIGIIQPMLLFFLIIFFRNGIKYLSNIIHNKRNKLDTKKNVLIYGAGDAGRQLAAALENSIEFKVFGFVDDDSKLYNRNLLGKNIYSPTELEKLAKTKNISLVFLSLPSINRNIRNKIIEKLNNLQLAVKTLPSLNEIVDGRITTSDIRDFHINDLLNRDEIKPDKKLLNKNINSKTILVTGAGGSIGSELCRQITKLKPKSLILLEFNEFALYKIYEELIVKNETVKITPLLVNAQAQTKIEKIFETFKVDTVYHAAAYKHVNLVEQNICEGVKNNVFSTISLVNAAINKNVSNFVLISSDKAVRSTNIMGASKRLSELCVQSIYNYRKKFDLNFSIVRFGNVLESSGSVIPRFKQQIKDGGPVTLTHKDVTRYFMTITEAAQLVIQAGAMGKYSEVFVLNMGERIKIYDLIVKMINLSGLTLKNNQNPNGDIEIKIIGLRSGEKLYEELLIGNDPKKTNHPKIFMINEPYVPMTNLQKNLDALKIALEKNKVEDVKKLLERLVKSYKSNTNIVDLFYMEKNKSITVKN